MNNLPVFLLGGDAEVPAVLRCHAAYVQIFSAFSHEELFHAQLGRLKVQTFNNQQLLVLDKQSAAVAVYSPFYRNLTAYLFHQEVIFPLFVAYQRNCRLELLVTAEALLIKNQGSESVFQHGKFCFQITETRFQIEADEVELGTADEAQQLFFLLFFLKTAYQGGIADFSGALLNQSASMSPGRALSENSYTAMRQSVPIDDLSVCQFKQRVSSSIRPRAHAEVGDYQFGKFSHASQADLTINASMRCTQTRSSLNLAEKLVRSVNAGYQRVSGAACKQQRAFAVVYDGFSNGIDEFADLLGGKDAQAEARSAEKRGLQLQQRSGTADTAFTEQQDADQGKAPTMPTEVLYDIRDAQEVLKREENRQETSATDELDASHRGIQIEFQQVDQTNGSAECVEVVEETFSVDSEDEHGAFLQAVERLSAGVSCLNARKKPTHLAFRVGKQIIMQQKVFCGNQVVAGVVGVRIGERAKDLQAFDVQCKDSADMRFYGSAEQADGLKAAIDAVLDGLRKGCLPE